MLDEVPIAFVIPQDGSPKEAIRANIEAACSATIAAFKQPREVRIVD